MIRDSQNTFCKELNLAAQTATASLTDVIFTGGGDAVNQMYLVVAVPVALQDGTLTVTLQTSDTENFAIPKDLGTFTVPKAIGIPVKARLPIGCQKYLRLKLVANLDATKTSLGNGKITAFLAYDVDIA